MNEAARLLQMRAKLASEPCLQCFAWTCGACGHQRTVRVPRFGQRCARCRATTQGTLQPIFHLVDPH